MCKHVAAVLYGIGARFDTEPELLFGLRGVAGADLLAHAASGLALAAPEPEPDRVLAEDDLAVLFGLELGDAPEAAPVAPAKAGKVPKPRAKAVKAADPEPAPVRPAKARPAKAAATPKPEPKPKLKPKVKANAKPQRGVIR
jgi:uncharacterized Zn finger protein